MLIRDILDLQRGSVVEFEKLASEPVDILINGKKMAEGEVVVIEKHFGIRITNLVDAAERVAGPGDVTDGMDVRQKRSCRSAACWG